MNEYDRYNERIRAEGAVFFNGKNRTRCSVCGAQGAEFQGDLNDAGESIALCVGPCDGDDFDGEE